MMKGIFTSTSPRRAFTLIELLIVITIIGVLTSILILNFQGVKEKQEISLLASKSLALMQQAKADVRSGKVEANEDGEMIYLCEGALFVDINFRIIFGEICL